jgi:Na+-driven multidrug efflux pump
MVAGYWLIGLPVSIALGFYTPLRAAGLWWGFVFSLGAVAIFLLLRIRTLFGRELRRVEIEDAAALHVPESPAGHTAVER